MTGTVEWSMLLWIVGAIVGAFVAGAIGVWRIAMWAAAEFSKRDLAIAAANARATASEDMLGQSLAEHKLYVAEHYATEDAVAKSLEPVLKALDRITDRLDQIFANGAPARPNPRTRS
jgi:hypothetical protein